MSAVYRKGDFLAFSSASLGAVSLYSWALARVEAASLLLFSPIEADSIAEFLCTVCI